MFRRPKKPLPAMAAALVPRELASWSLTSLALGGLEGGLLGVIVKNQFAGVAGPAIVNLAVAIVVGAPAFANLASFLFASRAVGRDKVAYLCRLMWLMGVVLTFMAIPGQSLFGLIAFCAMAVLGRMAWSGIITVRAAVWRLNYDRRWRGRVTARIVQLASLLIAAVSSLTGYLLDWRPDIYRGVFVLAAIAAFAASVVYSRTRVRRHRQLMAAEQARPVHGGGGLGSAIALMRRDADFRRYMGGMMLFGSGNLMVTAMLVVSINDAFDLPQLHQVLITASIPLAMLCLSIRAWAGLMEDRHIFEFRAVQSWTFVAAIGIFAVALIAQAPWLLWPGAFALGTAMGGGHLGWNLGHHDFSNDADSSLYMTIHVTLTGLRGLIMPVVAVVFYQQLQLHFPGWGAWAWLLPFSLSLSGSLWFLHLHRKRRNESADEAASVT